MFWGDETARAALKERQNLFSVEVHAVCFIYRKVCAFGAAAPAAIFAGV